MPTGSRQSCAIAVLNDPECDHSYFVYNSEQIRTAIGANYPGGIGDGTGGDGWCMCFLKTAFTDMSDCLEDDPRYSDALTWRPSECCAVLTITAATNPDVAITGVCRLHSECATDSPPSWDALSSDEPNRVHVACCAASPSPPPPDMLKTWLTVPDTTSWQEGTSAQVERPMC